MTHPDVPSEQETLTVTLLFVQLSGVIPIAPQAGIVASFLTLTVDEAS